MNKTIMVKDLVEGSVCSADVYIDGENLFVPANVAIRGKDIKRLTSLGIDSVETKGSITLPAAETKKAESKPGAKAKSRAARTPPSAKKDPYSTYIELIEELAEFCIKIQSNVTVESDTINDIADKLIFYVHEQRNSFIGFILGGKVEGYTMAKSLINSAILSALIAIELKLQKKILSIVIGALLHDVGMLRMPREIVEKRGGLSAAELQRIQAHTLYTYKIVSQELGYQEDVGLIALQHHERWDGEGYPRRLAGKDIDIGARIVSVADAFEAMVSQKPYRNSMIGYQAMKNLLSDNLRSFDPDVIKAFIQTMGVYPIGSIILLNNGAMARVVDVQATAPLRPTIRILADKAGNVFKQGEGELIDLLADKRLFIARAVDPNIQAG